MKDSLDHNLHYLYPNRSGQIMGIIMSEQLMPQIEAQLEELIQRYKILQQENQSLRTREAKWVAEHKQLIQKNEIARQRIEALIPRMRQLEAETE